MKNKTGIGVLVGLLLAVPVLAGNSGKKCAQPVHECLNAMVAKLKSSGFIGVELDDTVKKGALIVKKVIEGTPAEAAGFQVGDEFYAINGIKVDYSKPNETLQKVMVPGNAVTCTVKRNGADLQFKITLVPMPADLMAKYIGEHMMEHAMSDTKVANK